MFDDHRLMRNPVSYLTGRQANFNLYSPATNTRLKMGALMRPVIGGPLENYPSPMPSRSSSPLYDMFEPGTAAETYRFPSGVSFTAKMSGGGPSLNLALAPGGIATAVRVLPWGEDATTYMQLDNEAELWFTGPLSGCNIYACGTGRNIWVMHANANAYAGNLSLGNIAKRMAALNVATTQGAANPLWSHLERGSAGYNGLGFVFGWRKGDNWTNYYHDGQGTVTQLR